MIRAKLFRGLRTGSMRMASLYQDERLKLTEELACSYCGSTGPVTLDHLVPRAAGGVDDGHNLIRACRSCNSSKGKRDFLAWHQERNAFPRLLLLRRYLKLAAVHCERVDLLDAELVDDRVSALPFELWRLPVEFPSLAELRL